MFVIVEGIEGSGKSTLLAGVSERLRDAGREVVVTREPGGTPAGDAVRAIFLDPAINIGPIAEAMLVNAARAQHVSDVIRPALASGKIVLCDRFVDSTIAYQGYGRGLDVGLVALICDAAVAGVTPDLTLLLDVPVEVSRSRMQSRGAVCDRMEAEDDGFHERVRQGFLKIAAASPAHQVLDGTLDVKALTDLAYDAIASQLRIEAGA